MFSLATKKLHFNFIVVLARLASKESLKKASGLDPTEANIQRKARWLKCEHTCVCVLVSAKLPSRNGS